MSLNEAGCKICSETYDDSSHFLFTCAFCRDRYHHSCKNVPRSELTWRLENSLRKRHRGTIEQWTCSALCAQRQKLRENQHIREVIVISDDDEPESSVDTKSTSHFIDLTRDDDQPTPEPMQIPSPPLTRNTSQALSDVDVNMDDENIFLCSTPDVDILPEPIPMDIDFPHLPTPTPRPKPQPRVYISVIAKLLTGSGDDPWTRASIKAEQEHPFIRRKPRAQHLASEGFNSIAVTLGFDDIIPT